MGASVSKEGDLSQYIAQIEKNIGKLPSVPGINVMPSIGNNAGVGPATGLTIGKAVLAILSMLLIVGIFLTLVHFFITPIFKFKPGDKGIIPINVKPDSTVYWQGTATDPISMKDSAISNSAAEYSMTLDIFMNNPTQFAKNKGFRPVFVRSAKTEYTGPGEPVVNNPQTFFQQFGQEYNLAIYFDKDTNDLIVSTTTVQRDQISVRVENVPVRKSFRIGVVVGNTVMDVYMNGRLYRSVVYNAMPVSISSPTIMGPDPILGSMVQVRLLQLWSRPLEPGALRDMIPALSKFHGTDIQDSTSCSVLPSVSQVIESTESAAIASLKNVTD